jgi:hypothetical protein
MPLFGSQHMPTKTWRPGTRVSGIDALHEEFIVDPGLLPVGTDPRFVTDAIVIPKGRIVSVRPDNYTYEGKAMVTLANGVDPDNVPATGVVGNRPVGYNQASILRKHPERTQWMPVIDKQTYIEVPYMTDNDAYGTLKSGDKVTAYYGSTTSTTAINYEKRGKPVKWVPETLYGIVQSSSTTVSLTDAVYPAFKPKQIYTNVAGVTSTFAWNGTNWVATTSSAVTNYIYSFGQKADQIAGQVIKIEALSATHEFSGWLKWVTDDFKVWDYPPQMIRVPVTAVTNENPLYISTGVYRLQHKPVAIHKTITVTLAPTGAETFTVYDVDGTTLATVTSGTPYDLPMLDVPLADWTMGQYHTIDPVTGNLTLSPSVVFSGSQPSAGDEFDHIQVDYHYETGYRDGRLFASGIIGLTDGSNTGYPGTPTNLDVVNGLGALRLIVY